MAEKKKLSEKIDKRYRSKVLIGHDSEGKPILRYAAGRTKAELERNKEELLRTFVTGCIDSRRDILFGVYAQEWYDAFKKPNLSASSRQAYASTFNTHLLPVFGQRQLRAITANDLQLFMNSKAGYSGTTLAYMKTVFVNVFQMAYARGVIDRDPSVGLQIPKFEKEVRRALTAAESSAALKVGHEHPEGLLLLILYYTGLRIGEALGLQWRDIDFSKRVLHVQRDIDMKTGTIGALKTKSSNRRVPIPDDLLNALLNVRGVGETFVLQAPESHSNLSLRTYTRRWNRLMQAMYEYDNSIDHKPIKVEKPKKSKKQDKSNNENKNNRKNKVSNEQRFQSVLTAHYFRHNYASVLYNADVDVLSAQRFLGHADVKTTLSIYSHLSEGKEDRNADKVRNAFSI